MFQFFVMIFDCDNDVQVFLSGYLFDKFLINEVFDMIEVVGGLFYLVKCELGQSVDVELYLEFEVSFFF